MTVKVLLDTDIGSDIDDAVCLAYLLAQPECELLGVTTVSGEPVLRAQIASALCKAAGVDVPIYPGMEEPLSGEQRQPKAQQAAKLPNWEHDTEFPEGEAISFLQQTIRDNPGEVVLLAIGPMTNVGQLFRLDPEIPGLLKALVLMCGRFTDQPHVADRVREWNALCDPDAADIVYRANAPLHHSVGLDVTMQVVMQPDEVRRRFDTPLLRPVRDFAEVWFEKASAMVFHDPLAAAVVFDPTLCEWTAGTVTVELIDPDERGRTDWSPGGGDERHEVATAVDAARFFEHYWGTLNSAASSSSLLPFAQFDHPDGSWYRLWITRTTPKTPRGHPWHLHASYDKSGTLAPVAGTPWYEQPYGMSDWDFDTQEEAEAAFRERTADRIRHGYTLREGRTL
jgi:purine nucleosidase